MYYTNINKHADFFHVIIFCFNKVAYMNKMCIFDIYDCYI